MYVATEAFFPNGKNLDNSRLTPPQIYADVLYTSAVKVSQNYCN